MREDSFLEANEGADRPLVQIGTSTLIWCRYPGPRIRPFSSLSPDITDQSYKLSGKLGADIILEISRSS